MTNVLTMTDVLTRTGARRRRRRYDDQRPYDELRRRPPELSARSDLLLQCCPPNVPRPMAPLLRWMRGHESRGILAQRSEPQTLPPQRVLASQVEAAPDADAFNGPAACSTRIQWSCSLPMELGAHAHSRGCIRIGMRPRRHSTRVAASARREGAGVHLHRSMLRYGHTHTRLRRR